MERMVGRKAPDFTLETVLGDGSAFGSRSLSDYAGRWLVLFFYPMDFTFVCPTELTGFSERYEEFAAAGADILAVSCDSKYSHLAWINDGLGELNYPLGADKTLKVASDYGVLLEDEGVTLRGLFIIDPEQTVRYSVIHDNNVGRSVDETLRVLKALQTGGLCAAGWTAGSDTLHPEEVPAEEPMAHSDARVRVYSMPDCGYCKKVKEYLTQQGIEFENFDLSTSKIGQQFMDSHGFTRLPVTVVGETIIEGYDMGKLKKALRGGKIF